MTPYIQITQEERFALSLLRRQGFGVCAIARLLNRAQWSPSVMRTLRPASAAGSALDAHSTPTWPPLVDCRGWLG